MKLLYFSLLSLFVCSSVFSAEAIQRLETTDAPKPMGAYSQIVSVDLEQTKKLIFVSVQYAMDPVTGKMVENDIHAATNQTLDNMEAILKKAGSDWEHVVRMDVFLLNYCEENWAAMNQEMAKRFKNGAYPVRQTIGAKMDDDSPVQMSCIAVVPKD